MESLPRKGPDWAAKPLLLLQSFYKGRDFYRTRARIQGAELPRRLARGSRGEKGKTLSSTARNLPVTKGAITKDRALPPKSK
jgi:hypothetical protein